MDGERIIIVEMKTLGNIISLILLIIVIYAISLCKYAIGFTIGILTVPIYNLVKMYVLLVKDNYDQRIRDNEFYRKSQEQWTCYEIHRPNIPANGCSIQCNECRTKQENK